MYPPGVAPAHPSVHALNSPLPPKARRSPRSSQTTSAAISNAAAAADRGGENSKLPYIAFLGFGGEKG
jgi:hypothetical protein